jgi:hypothetical protein
MGAVWVVGPYGMNTYCAIGPDGIETLWTIGPNGMNTLWAVVLWCLYIMVGYKMVHFTTVHDKTARYTKEHYQTVQRYLTVQLQNGKHCSHETIHVTIQCVSKRYNYETVHHKTLHRH